VVDNGTLMSHPKLCILPPKGPRYNLAGPSRALFMVQAVHAAVVERQTRQLEGLVPARVWGFKSPSPHFAMSRGQRTGGASLGDPS
jgi:hypothetical protein